MTLEISRDITAFKIGGITYSVERVDKLLDDTLGYTDVNASQIFIATDGVSMQKQEQTLLHEALHAMLHEAGLDEEVNNENLVLPLANILYQFITENQLYFKEK